MASSVTICPSTKKKKPAAQPTQKASTPSLASSSASASFASSFVASIELDSTSDSSSMGTEPEIEVEPIVPRIIYEDEEEEDMVANLRVGFKESVQTPL